MTAILTPPVEATQKVILDNISWETYLRLLEERGETPQPRYSYDHGRLEIMVASYERESLKHDIAALVEAIAEVFELDLVGAGSTTFNREDLAQGVEPDVCVYIENAERIRGKKRIDLAVDPAPELLIEVDIASPSLNKFPIFAGLGIAEAWRYHKQTLTILALDSNFGVYREQAESNVLTGVTPAGLTCLIAEARELKRTVWLRS
ncbi:MAG TPA: Uma2 family endonuclease, partial [Blastocatellia bacterium]|nr:Uma2 family endonuclease [Blastocatellia bacterium]